MESFKRHSCTSNGHTTSYLEAGPENGPLLIFAHGWPDVALGWRNQLAACAAVGFRAVAADMRGYGDSTAPRDSSKYALEYIVGDMVALLAHLNRSEAVWIGHDWGVPVLSALAAHHPELCTALVLLAVPYRTFELGLDWVVSLTNREIYPEEEYPYGPFEYQKAYEVDPEAINKAMDVQPEKLLKTIYRKGDPSNYLKPARTSRALREGLYKHADRPDMPDVPLSQTVLDESLHAALVATAKKNGFFPATSYYLNHAANAAYAKSERNGGVLGMPVLYLDAKYDGICSPHANPRVAWDMRKMCRNLTECTIEAAHWLHLEKPVEVNAALIRWLATALPQNWPTYWLNPFVKGSL